MQGKRPQLKFLKEQVDNVLKGKKTLEPRPRSRQWIERIANVVFIDLTYGARFKPPVIFATAKVLKVEVRPFETTTKEDLIKISRGWEEKEPEEFIRVHNEWFAKELSRGLPVLWIYFRIIKKYDMDTVLFAPALVAS